MDEQERKNKVSLLMELCTKIHSIELTGVKLHPCALCPIFYSCTDFITANDFEINYAYNNLKAWISIYADIAGR